MTLQTALYGLQSKLTIFLMHNHNTTSKEREVIGEVEKELGLIAKALKNKYGYNKNSIFLSNDTKGLLTIIGK